MACSLKESMQQKRSSCGTYITGTSTQAWVVDTADAQPGQRAGARRGRGTPRSGPAALRPIRSSKRLGSVAPQSFAAPPLRETLMRRPRRLLLALKGGSDGPGRQAAPLQTQSWHKGARSGAGRELQKAAHLAALSSR